MKAFFLSRTLWVNLLAAVAFFLQSQYGYIIPLELQAEILALINFVLRFFTSSKITLNTTA